MSGWLSQIAGGALVALTLADVFLTVLHTRGDAGVLSTRLNHMLWLAIRELSRLAGRQRMAMRAYAGPLALTLTVALWVTLVTVGFALIAWPHLGSDIRSTLGPTPTDFFTAAYYSGMALTTLGLGDFMPHTVGTRATLLVEALLGFSMVTLSLTYFLSIYNALIRRNAFAAELHYMSARTGDAAELLVRIGSSGRFDGDSRSDLATVARELLTLLQTHHAFPVIHLFVQPDIAMAPARVALLSLDTAALVRSALDQEVNRDFIDSSAIEVLWDGGMHLLIETGRDILTQADRDASDPPHRGDWGRRFRAAHRRLADAGFAVESDLTRGEAAYVAQRRRWDGHVRAFAAHMGQRWDEIEPPRCRGEGAMP